MEQTLQWSINAPEQRCGDAGAASAKRDRRRGIRGSPNRSRAAAVTALTGFQSATVRNTAGMCWVGTSALETKASGKRMTSPTPCAGLGSLADMPRQAQPHEIA